MKIKNVCLFFRDPIARFRILNSRGFYKHLPDEKFLKIAFRKLVNQELDLDNPKTFNEKMQWLKLYNRQPIHTQMVDKYEVKKYVAKKIGEEYVIPTLGVWEHFGEIDFEKLPNQFVLKCTHDSGGLIICKDKTTLNLKRAKKIIQRSLTTNYFDGGREWPYKDVKPRIIAEKYMTNDEESDELTDYKFFCFNGSMDCVLVCYDRASGDTKFYFFDENWNLKRINKRGLEAPQEFSLPKPQCFDRMVQIAKELSAGHPFLRVDLYESAGKIYFGELTFFPQSGFDPNYLPETDKYFGDLIDLSLVKKSKEEQKL